MEIINSENGAKMRVVKAGDLYNLEFWEYSKARGWRLICTDNGWTKDAVECEYDIRISD